MDTDSLGKMFPRMLLPYVQQWAARSDLTVLSTLLVDEQFQGLIEKYGNEMITLLTSYAPGNDNSRPNEKNSSPSNKSRVSEPDADANYLERLQERVSALEKQYEAQQAMLVVLHTKLSPLAAALGCCSECLVGLDGCAKCGGHGRVGHFQPDYSALQTQVVSPLTARGVPLSLNQK